MTEVRTIADNIIIRYEGIFNMHELCKMIDDWQKQRGFDRHEIKNFEHVHANGRDIEIELQPWKKINDTEKIVIKIIILVKNMKDVIVNRDGIDVKMNQGQLQVKVYAFFMSDIAYKWEGKPYYHFLAQVFDKYIYRMPISRHIGMVSEEVGNLTRNIRGYLNIISR